MSEVAFDGVTKRFGEVTAVDQLSLTVLDGEFMVLLGPSGCGKTTALRMIAGLETVTEGELRIGDRVVNDVEAKDRDIAMVFQSYALYPHMTVAKNIESPLMARKFTVEAEGHAPQAHGRRAHRAGRAGRRVTRAHRPARPQARRPVGWPAPAGRPGPGDGGPPRRVPDGRAAVEPRRQAPRPDPHRARRAAPAPGHHVRVRHPRPGRGHDDGRPDRGDERRPPAAGGSAAGRLRPSPQSVRRPLHRLAAHEHRPRHGRAHRRRNRRPARWPDHRGRAHLGRATGRCHVGGHRRPPRAPASSTPTVR